MSDELPGWLGGGFVCEMGIVRSAQVIEDLMEVLWRAAAYGALDHLTYHTGEFSRWCGWQLERLSELKPALPAEETVGQGFCPGDELERVWALCAQPDEDHGDLPAVIGELTRALEALGSARCAFANRNLAAWARSAHGQLGGLEH